MRGDFFGIFLSAFCLFLGTHSLADNPPESRTRYYRHEISANIGVGTLNGKRWDTFREKMEDRFALSFKHGYAHTTTPLGIRLQLSHSSPFVCAVQIFCLPLHRNPPESLS